LYSAYTLVANEGAAEYQPFNSGFLELVDNPSVRSYTGNGLLALSSFMTGIIPSANAAGEKVFVFSATILTRW
jgi:hypothetical protein